MWEWATKNGDYMSWVHCMDHDWPWIIAVMVLCGIICSGYVAIAINFWRAGRKLKKTRTRYAMYKMAGIFLMCAACGYGWHFVHFFASPWRLYVLFLALLGLLTWLYALNPVEMRNLVEDLEELEERRSATPLADRLAKHIPGGELQ